MDSLQQAAIEQALAEDAGCFALDVVAECGSTNHELLEAAARRDGRLAVLAAETQTAGRGRRGRSWLGWPQAGLAFSLRWPLPTGELPSGLSLICGLAVAKALEELGAYGVCLKWPNDILLRTPEGLAKLGGILIELVPGGRRPQGAVIGIGLNVALPAEASVPGDNRVADLRQALVQQGGSMPSRNRILATVLRHLRRTLIRCRDEGFSGLRVEWEQRHAFHEQPVRLEEDGKSLYGTCAGVDSQGILLLRNDSGLHKIMTGDVCSLRPGDVPA